MQLDDVALRHQQVDHLRANARVRTDRSHDRPPHGQLGDDGQRVRVAPVEVVHDQRAAGGHRPRHEGGHGTGRVLGRQLRQGGA